MKRKSLITILTTTFAVTALAACGILFAGCGDTAGSSSYEVESYEVETDASSTVGRLSSLGAEGSWSTPVRASEAKFDVYLSDWYDADTVVIKANGKAVSFTKDADFTERSSITGGFDKIGTLDYTSIKEDTAFTVEAQPKQINFTFELADAHYETPLTQTDVEAQRTALSDFKLSSSSNTTLYHALTQEGVKYTVDCVTLMDTNGGLLKFYCNKQWSYYDAYGLLKVTENDLMPDYDGGDVHAHQVSVSFPSKDNVVKVDPLAVNLRELSFYQDSGSIIRISSALFEDGRYSFASDKTGTVNITLDETGGADLTGAELYINDKKVEMTNKGYTLTVNPANGTPLDFINDMKPATDVTAYHITVKKADFSSVTDIVKLTGANFVSCYYTDGTVSYILPDSGSMGVEYSLEVLDRQPKNYRFTVTLTPVSGSTVTVTAELSAALLAGFDNYTQVNLTGTTAEWTAGCGEEKLSLNVLSTWGGVDESGRTIKLTVGVPLIAGTYTVTCTEA